MPAVYSSCLNRLISCNSLQLASRIQRSHHLLSDGYPACFAAQRTRLRGSIKDVPRTSIAKFKRHILEQKHYQSKLLMFSTTSMLLNREVPLTSEQYPSLKRGKFGSVEADDVSFFESILPGRVVTERDELEGANTDWLRICRGTYSQKDCGNKRLIFLSSRYLVFKPKYSHTSVSSIHL